jgi:phosphoribosyl-AMP cyclohydrolase
VVQDWSTGEVLTVAYMNEEALARTRWTLPEVSPLCHSSWRERLQNHVSPLSRVRARASSFM